MDLMEQLTEKMLELGGSTIWRCDCGCEEKIAEGLLKFGKLYTPEEKVHVPMLSNNCYKNAWTFAEATGFDIIRGYALGAGVWWGHSAVWDYETDTLYETTSPNFELYFMANYVYD